MILQPAARIVECVVQRDLQVFVVLARDGDLAAGDLELDAHRVLLALALVARVQLEDHAAARDAVVILLELRGLLADGVVDRVGVL
jgi:hypothetical protein